MANSKMTIEEFEKKHGKKGNTNSSTESAMEEFEKKHRAGASKTNTRTTQTPLNRIGILPTLRGGGKATPTLTDILTHRKKGFEALGQAEIEAFNNSNGLSAEIPTADMFDVAQKKANIRKEYFPETVSTWSPWYVPDGKGNMLYMGYISDKGREAWETNKLDSYIPVDEREMEALVNFDVAFNSSKTTREIYNKEDFAEKSKYSPTTPKTEEELKAEGYKQARNGRWYTENIFGEARQWYRGEDSDLYTYINDENSRAGIEASQMSGMIIPVTSGDSVGLAGMSLPISTYKENGYATMNDVEKGVFNYLYHQDKENGTKTAEEYIEELKPILVKRAQTIENMRYSEMAKENPGFMSVASLGTNFADGLMFWPKLAVTAMGEDTTVLNTYGSMTQAIRGTVAEDLPYWGGLVYQGGMSLADFAIAMGVGYGGGGGKSGVQFIMSSQAGSSTLSRAKESGASDGKAIILGLGAAAIEWATEKYSIEAILKNPKTIKGYIFSNIVTEGTEEGVSNIANAALDDIISNVFEEPSEIEQRVNYLVTNEGMTKEEALQTAVYEKLQSLGEDVLVGAFTGAGMSSVVATPAIVENEINKKKVIDTLVEDEDSLNVLIKEGKSGGEGSKSYEIAEEVEQATANGTVTRKQIKQLVKANESLKKVDRKSFKPDSLEQAAIDVANERNKPSSTPLHERLNALSQTNEPIAVEDVKKATGFGDNGSKLVATLANNEGVTFSQAERMVKNAYMAGLTNAEGKTANFATDTQIDAFTAGKQDRVMQELADKANAEDAVVNKKSGFVAKNLPSDVTQRQVEVVDLLAKAFGVKVVVKKGIKGNAEIDHSTGEVAINFDFEREVGSDNNRQKVSIVYHAVHEMAAHALIKRAPVEGRAFVNALYNLVAGDESSFVSTLADEKRREYAKQDVELSLAYAIEEVSANNIIKYLYDNDETKFQNAMERIINGNDTKAKQGLQKYLEILNEIIRKIKNFIAGKKGKDRAELQAGLDEVTRVRDMFENAVAKGVENTRKAEAKSTKNLEIKTNKDYNGNISNSLKKIADEGYSTKGTKWAIANGLLTKKEQAKFWEDIANLSKRGYYIPKSKTGQYIIDVGQKLVFTNGNFKTATISCIIEFEDGYESNINDYKEWIIDEERNTAQHGESLQIIEIVQGEGYVREHLPSAYRTDARENGRRKGADSKRTSSRDGFEVNKSFSLKDSDYLKAVENNDMETAQRMVDEVAKEAGYNIRAYHGTPNNEFTIFDKNRVGKGTDQYGAGFYFASNKDAARAYGSRVINSRLGITKPLKIDGSSDVGANLIQGADDYLLTEEQAYEVIKRLPNIYDDEESPLGDYYDSYWENGAEDWMIEDLAASEGNRNIGYLDSDLFRNYPNELHEALRDVVGYDGVEVTFENGDKFYVAWFDNQMKSNEPVTYDDKGNVIPLSERFNKQNNDINYSLKDSGYSREVDNVGLQIDSESKSIAPSFSLKTWNASQYVKDRDTAIKAIVKAVGVTEKDAARYIDNINSIARMIADDRVRLDYDSNLDETATVLKSNSEYKWTVDMSTLCAKRLLTTGTFDAIQKALPNTVFDSDDIVRLRSMMLERGYEVACGICYVESTRRELGPITAEFIERYKISQKTGEPITRVNSEGKTVELKKTKDQMETTKDKSTDKFVADKNYTPTLAELNTTDIDMVKRDHPLVYEAYLNFMNARGQAKPKLLETRAEYKGEILKHFKSKSAVNARNQAGGLRVQSFSDFEIAHLIDMMQIVLDMSQVGLMSQAYTKVPAFADVFGNTGIKINLSLIAKDAGLDENGNLIFDDVEGMPHEEAFLLRDKYSKNVGTILVGKNDAHIRAALADPRIDFVIPFHKSSWKESLYDALGLTGYEDYTDFQNEKPFDKERKIKNFQPSEYWDYSKSGEKNAQTYLKMCAEDGRIPKFPQFQNCEGYWKLLIDFKMYDNDGVGSPQTVVQPNFAMDEATEILNAYEGGHRTLPVAQDVVDDFVEQYKSDKSFSLKNTNNTDTKDRKELLDIIEHLKGEFEVTKFAKADPKKLAKLTKDILKEYNSKADFDETRSAIDELYTYMANGEDGNTAVWDEVYNRAYNIAQNIVENSLVVDDEMYMHYKSLRDYLRTTPMKFDTRYDSVPSSYENFNEFRKLNMGRLKFTNDGRGIGSVYQELAGLYPEFFNKEEQNNASDQLERIIEVLDELQPTQINPFDRQISQVSMQLANDLTSRFFDLPQAKPTFADKAEHRVVAERIKSGKKVEAVRQQNNERIKKLIESQKAKTKKQLDKIREQRNAKVEKERERRKNALSKMSEKQKAKVLRARIIHHTEKLSTTLRKATDKKHIPPELENAVVALLSNINLESNYVFVPSKEVYTPNEITNANDLYKAYVIASLTVERAKKLDAKKEDVYQARADVIQYAKTHNDTARLLGESQKDLDKKLKTWETHLAGKFVKENRLSEGQEGLPTNKTKAFLALKEVYAEIAKNNDYGLTLASELVDTTGDGVANIFDEVMKLSDTKIADMTSEELTKIYDAIRIIEHSIKTANKMFAMQRWEDLTKTAKAFELSVATRRPKHAMMKSHLTLDIETPLTFFSHFGVAGEELYKALRNAQDNEQRMIDELAERIQGIVSSEQVKKAEKEYFTFTTVEGKELTLSKAHIMDMYLLFKRKQGRKHLLYDPDSKHFGNGIHQPEIKGKHIRRDSESTRLTKVDLGKIFSKLDASDKAIADKMQKATLLLAKWGNKASMDVFGYEKFNDPDYWTIKSASESINQTPEKNKDIARSIKNMGSAKSIEEKAANAVDIGGIFNVFNQHASDMICYSAWLGVMEDATKLYNYTFRDAEGNKTNRTFQSMLEKYAGEGGKKYYFNLLKDIQNGISAPPDTATEGIYTRLYGMAAKAAVAFKATVVVQQPMSIVRATNTISPLSILQATVKGGVNLPVWAVSKVKNIVPGQSGQLLSEWYGGWQKALKYSPIASRKAIGGYEINSNSSGLKGVLYNPDTIRGKTVDALKESPLWAAGKADELTWGLLWNACEIETRRKNKALEKGSEAYYEAVNELFTKVINETQVVDGVLQRSQLMRSSSGWIKPATSFTGEPTQALNAVMRAYDSLRYETGAKRGKAIKKFSRAVTVFLASAVFTAFARSLAVGLTGEDDDEYWDKVWKSFSGIQGDEETWFDYVKNIGLKSDAVNNVNPFTWLPIAREIMSMLEGYDVERLDVGSLSKFVKEAEKFIESFSDEGKYTVGYSLRNLLLKTAEFTGYSPYNLIKDIEGAIRTIKRESEDYKGLYEMEKKRTKPANNTSAYIDILYKAYSADSKDYEYIYEDLVKEIKEGLLEKGIELTEDDKKDGKTVEMVAQEKAEETIESGMETRMKKAEGVEKSSELTKRYMSPETEDKYDSSLNKVKHSDVWKSANAEQRKNAEADLYKFLTSTAEDVEKLREEARMHGVDETEYTLYQLAIEMADQPKGQKGSGSYDLKEKAEAINSLNLGDEEIAYFFGRGLQENAKEELQETLDAGIDIQKYVNFKAAVSDMEADKNAKGNSIPNSKKKKVVKYLNNANLTDEEWEYFYYEIMNYKK